MSHIDGIPWASVWLNDTYNSLNGTFVPLATPAVTGNRMYLLTAFWAKEKPKDFDNFALRLYAIDITDNAVGRIQIAWTMTTPITGYLSAIEGNFNDCKFVFPPHLGSTNSKPVGLVMTVQNAVIFSLNFNDVRGGYDRYLIMRINDTVNNYKSIFYYDASYESHLFMSSLNYMETPLNNKLKSSISRSRSTFGNYFMVGRQNTSIASDPSSYIDILTIDGYSFTTLSLDALLTPLVDVQFTSYLMSVELAPVAESYLPPFSYLCLIFGAKGAKSDNVVESYLVGVEVDISGQARLLWKILMSDQCEAVGLISTDIDEKGKLILIVNTVCGISTYAL